MSDPASYPLAGTVATEDSDGRSRSVIGVSILFVILALSFAFFWSGNVVYGLLMVAIPSLSIIVSTCCYLSEPPAEPASDSEELNLGFLRNEDQDPASRLPDRPPSYRLTWRRSFIKRLRGVRQSFTDHEKEDDQSSSPTGELEGIIVSKIEESSTEAGPQTVLVTVTEFLESEAHASGSSIAEPSAESEPSEEEPKPVTKRTDSSTTVKSSSTNVTKEEKEEFRKSLKFPLVPKESLPTYHEAMDIKKSFENLTKMISDESDSSSSSS